VLLACLFRIFFPGALRNIIKEGPAATEVLDRLRGRIGDALLKMGKGASRVMPSPTAWTISGLLFSILAGVLLSKGGYSFGALGGLCVLASGILDVVDGSVARATNVVSKRGAFLDSNLDRIGEVAVFFGLLLGHYAPATLIFLAVALSLMVSYARAKADSLNVSLAGVGIGERSERLLVIVIASFLGLLYWGVILVAALAEIAFIERVARGTSSLKPE
jgi:archaetidylinositol phosphate synthase